LRSHVKTGIAAKIKAAGGAIFGVTSEPQTLASEAEREWDLPYSVVGDPHHAIRNLCAGKGWSDSFYNVDAGHFGSRSWIFYPKGYFQPAVLAIHKPGRVLYRWRCVLKYRNSSEVGARLEASFTWEKIKESLSASGDAGT